MDFILAKQYHEGFKRMTMNETFPRTQDSTQSAPRQVRTLIERKGAINMQVSQDWKTLRWSRITLLSNPAAELIRMKVHVFSDSTLCLGIPNPDASNNWATKLDEVWNGHGFDKDLNLAARQVTFIWHVYPGACTLNIKKHVQTYPNGRNQDFFEDGVSWTVDVMRNKLPQQDSHQDHFGRQLAVCLQLQLPMYETENLVLTPRRSVEEEQINVDPDQLSIITREERNMSQGLRRLHAKTRCESRDSDSQSFRTGRIAKTVDIGQFNVTNESVIDGNSSTSTLLCREYSGPRNFVVQDYRPFLTIT